MESWTAPNGVQNSIDHKTDHDFGMIIWYRPPQFDPPYHVLEDEIFNYPDVNLLCERDGNV